jgi:hypothetical protein
MIRRKSHVHLTVLDAFETGRWRNTPPPSRRAGRRGPSG